MVVHWLTDWPQDLGHRQKLHIGQQTIPKYCYFGLISFLWLKLFSRQVVINSPLNERLARGNNRQQQPSPNIATLCSFCWLFSMQVVLHWLTDWPKALGHGQQLESKAHHSLQAHSVCWCIFEDLRPCWKVSKWPFYDEHWNSGRGCNVVYLHCSI